MAKAYISHPGSSKRISMQNVERGHKECIQVKFMLLASLHTTVLYRTKYIDYLVQCFI